MNSDTDSANQTDGTSTVPQATYAGAKRKIASLEQQIQALQEIGNTRKSYVAYSVSPLTHD